MYGFHSKISITWISSHTVGCFCWRLTTGNYNIDIQYQVGKLELKPNTGWDIKPSTGTGYQATCNAINQSSKLYIGKFKEQSSAYYDPTKLYSSTWNGSGGAVGADSQVHISGISKDGPDFSGDEVNLWVYLNSSNSITIKVNDISVDVPLLPEVSVADWSQIWTDNKPIGEPWGFLTYNGLPDYVEIGCFNWVACPVWEDESGNELNYQTFMVDDISFDCDYNWYSTPSYDDWLTSTNTHSITSSTKTIYQDAYWWHTSGSTTYHYLLCADDYTGAGWVYNVNSAKIYLSMHEGCGFAEHDNGQQAIIRDILETSGGLYPQIYYRDNYEDEWKKSVNAASNNYALAFVPCSTDSTSMKAYGYSDNITLASTSSSTTLLGYPIICKSAYIQTLNSLSVVAVGPYVYTTNYTNWKIESTLTPIGYGVQSSHYPPMLSDWGRLWSGYGITGINNYTPSYTDLYIDSRGFDWAKCGVMKKDSFTDEDYIFYHGIHNEIIFIKSIPKTYITWPTIYQKTDGRYRIIYEIDGVLNGSDSVNKLGTDWSDLPATNSIHEIKGWTNISKYISSNGRIFLCGIVENITTAMEIKIILIEYDQVNNTITGPYFNKTVTKRTQPYVCELKNGKVEVGYIDGTSLIVYNTLNWKSDYSSWDRIN